MTNDIFTEEEQREIKRLARQTPPYIDTRDQIQSGLLVPRVYFNAVTTAELVTGTSYGNPATVGPSLTLGPAGDYLITIGAMMYQTTGGGGYMSYSINGATAVDLDSISESSTATGIYMSRVQLKTSLPANSTLVAKYKTTSDTLYIRDRFIKAELVVNEA